MTSEDYEKVLIPAVEAKLKKNKKVRLLNHLGEDLQGFYAGAMWEDTKAGFDISRHGEGSDSYRRQVDAHYHEGIRLCNAGSVSHIIYQRARRSIEMGYKVRCNYRLLYFMYVTAILLTAY